MAFSSIPSSSVDAESPLDDQLLQLIKDNLDDHESRILQIKAYPLEWKVNGRLDYLQPVKSKYKRLDGTRIVAAQSFSYANLSLNYPAASGTLEVDIRKYRPVNHMINSIISLFTGSITSIANVAPALSTQSIARATAQISTQSITLFKGVPNVDSIILLGSNLVRYNLSGTTVDSDWKVGKTVTFASCTSGANNISATIVRINDDGGNNVVVTNASGVAQTSAAGTCTLRAYKYNFTNPVSSEFVATESAVFASHTAGANDGTFEIYAVNSGGNNIVVFNASGATQGGATGNCNVLRWIFSFSVSASTTDFVVGESAVTTGHSSGGNNSSGLRITAVNSGGNNLVLYNVSGVVQGGAAGTVNTNRWVYALGSDPSAYFTAGQTMVSASASNANNNGALVVKEVKRGGTNNLVVYNTAGVAQVGAAGSVTHSYMIVSLTSDLSSIYTTRSNVEIVGSPSSANNGYFDVVAVNQGGGSNYNVVVNNSSGVLQSSPAGRIVTESKSIFSTTPKIAFPTTGEMPYNNTVIATQTTAAAFHVTDSIVSAAEVTAGCVLAMDIVSLPTNSDTYSVYGSDLTVQVA